MATLETLNARINRNGDVNDPAVPRPIVTLEEFFEGNDDYGSIGYNFYPEQPAPSEFYDLFKRIRERPNVADVLVEVTQQEMPNDWPSTDTVWILTAASLKEVASWLGERFQADELWDGWTDHLVREPVDVPRNCRPVGVWWD
jgi:hypothetical protein